MKDSDRGWPTGHLCQYLPHHKNTQKKNIPCTVCLGEAPDDSAKPEFSAIKSSRLTTLVHLLLFSFTYIFLDIFVKVIFSHQSASGSLIF